MGKNITRKIKSSSWGLKVDKSNATKDYFNELEIKYGRPYNLPFPEGSSLNELHIQAVKMKHEKYKAGLK